MMRVTQYEFTTKEMKDILLLHLSTSGIALPGGAKVTFGQIARDDNYIYVLELREDKK